MNDDLKSRIVREVGLLEGWTVPERGIQMAELILAFPNKNIRCVELGVFGGKSLIPQAMALAANDSGVIYGVDPWKVEPALEGENEANREWWSKNVDLHQIHRDTMESIWRNGLDPYCVIIRATSQHAALLFENESIDVLNIDGNHSEVASTRDVNLYLPKVKPGGFIWMDDTDWSSTQKAVAMLRESCETVRDDSHFKLFCKR